VSGLLVSRDGDAPTPAAGHLPGLSALLRVSRDVGAIVLRGASAAEVQGAEETPWIAAARQSVADQLCAAASRATLTDAVVERLRESERFLGAEILSGACISERHDIGATLVPGARICFTGTAQDASGRIVEREEMERLASRAGLAPVKSVTKTRCEVLVTAEAGTQSGKARKAQEYGKPVFSADEFFAWVRSRQ
jgi:NAD-dependent DNA ligase